MKTLLEGGQRYYRDFEAIRDLRFVLEEDRLVAARFAFRDGTIIYAEEQCEI